MSLSFAPRILAAIALLLAWVPASISHAQDRPTLSGTWSASAMTVQYAIGQWGDKCGPKPSGGGPGGGTVTISQTGNELSINGAGGSYSTTNCFEQGSGLRRVSHSASPRGWSNRCTTASNDPRQAVVITTISATDTTISFNETGSYQFILEGQNCTASVRRTRSFSLIQRAGEPAKTAEVPPASAAPTQTATPTPTQTIAKEKEPPPPPPSCADVGEPARIEVRPARKLMRPGEVFSFRTRVVDAKGCRVDVHPAWSLANQDAKVSVDGKGTVTVGADAPEGTTEIVISLSGQQVRVSVEVASTERYDALLSARGLNASGEADEAAIATIATGSLGGGKAVSEDGARKRKLIFISVIAGMALVLAVAGVVLLRRSQKKKAALIAEQEQEELEAAREEEQAQELRKQRAQAAAMAGSMLLCPVCRKEFTPGRTYCPVDGTRLVPASEARGAPGGICPVCRRGFASSTKLCPEHGELLVPAAVFNATAPRSPAAPPKGKICPTCGSRYGGDAAFCGKDGTTLVLVN